LLAHESELTLRLAVAMPRGRMGRVRAGAPVDGNYEALKSAFEFEVLAAKTNDPHVKATYVKLAERYRAMCAVPSQGTVAASSNTNARQAAGTRR
jgi:hypothetical protein